MRFRSLLIGLCLLGSLCAGRASAQFQWPMLATVEDVPGRLSLRQDFGEWLGFDGGYTQVEAFVPVYQYGDLVFFTDGRFMYIESDGGFQQYSAGAGARYFSEGLDRTLGVYGFVDSMDGGPFTFHQLNFGFEILGDIFDLRGNFYYPIGDRVRDTGGAVFTVNRFQGTDVILNGSTGVAAVQPGGDVEVGVNIPNSELYQTRLAVGYYNYQGESASTIQGIRGRAELRVMDSLVVHASIQNDSTFNTTAAAGLEYHFGGPASTDGMIPLRDRRADTIVRNPNLVIREGTRNVEEAAIDPTTGLPVVVRHLDSTAAAGGDGSVERPFRTLADAETGSSARDILFAHAGSIFNPATTFNLKANQRLLGEGLTHTFVATQGTFTLPRATGGTARPVINVFPTGQIGVNLAQDNEISGLAFSTPQGVQDTIGIAGTGNLGFFTLNSNTFNGFSTTAFPNGAGIRLQDANGSGLILASTFSGGNSAVILNQLAPGNSLIVGLRNNLITVASATALDGQTTDGDLGIQLLNNRFTGGTFNLAGGNTTIRVEQTLGTNFTLGPPTLSNTAFVPPNSLGLP